MKDIKFTVKPEYQQDALIVARIKVAAYIIATAVSVIGLHKSSMKLGLIKIGIISNVAADLGGVSSEFIDGLKKLQEMCAK